MSPPDNNAVIANGVPISDRDVVKQSHSSARWFTGLLRFASATLAMTMVVSMTMGFSSCKKEPLGNDPLPPVSDTPSISLKSVFPATVTQLQDPIEFTIFYLDGNGDLGFYEADSNSIYVTDTRFPLTEAFQLQPLAPAGTDIAIQGELVVTLDDVILQDTANASEQATFKIKMRDRAGNWSNEVTSGVVTIVK